MRARLIRSPRTWYFVLGLFVAAIALLPPLHEWSEERLSAHMIQHELLMAVAAPLLVIGRPFVYVLLALPRRWRSPVARLAMNSRVRRVWSTITQPFAAWLIHALAIWLWHVPPLFDTAVRNDAVHVLQHASFLGSGVLFWWTIAHPVRRSNRGIAVLGLFTTAIHTAVLGALMTFAHHPWYDVYTRSTAGISALADQQLAGMIMWIPASLAYLIAALLVMRRWLADSDLESPNIVGITRSSQARRERGLFADSSRAERGIAVPEAVEPTPGPSDPASALLLGMPQVSE